MASEDSRRIRLRLHGHAILRWRQAAGLYVRRRQLYMSQGHNTELLNAALHRAPGVLVWSFALVTMADGTKAPVNV